MEKTFQMDLPLATLLEAPTIRQLAEIIRSGNVCSLSSSLVAFQPNGTKSPFFCASGQLGEVFFCRNLSHSLGPDQPVFALRQGLGEGSLHYSIEEMAAHYLSEIKTVQPTGPYFLGGYCFGGVVAYEMAQLLKKQGEEVALLVLFNAPTPDGLKAWPLRPAYLQKRITYALRELRSLPLQKKLGAIAKKAGWLSYYVAGNVEDYSLADAATVPFGRKRAKEAIRKYREYQSSGRKNLPTKTLPWPDHFFLNR
jgi:hypothetical protein